MSTFEEKVKAKMEAIKRIQEEKMIEEEAIRRIEEEAMTRFNTLSPKEKDNYERRYNNNSKHTHDDMKPRMCTDYILWVFMKNEFMNKNI